MGRLFLFTGFFVVVISSCSSPEKLPVPIPLSKAFSDGDTAGFQKATSPRNFVFPGDHFPHDGFKTEWWYVTGNVESAEKSFGYQITFFRIALKSEKSSEAGWKASHFWMAHIAITDLSEGRFLHEERFSREAKALAGFNAATSEINLESWKMSLSDSVILVKAQGDQIGLDLRLKPEKPWILQGDSGLSKKGAAAGNASYYYSGTRMRTSGTVRTGVTTTDVNGHSWFDREWSTSMLEDGAPGWDWFALHLDDGSDVMYYQLRTANGHTSPFSRGVLILADGSTVPLAFSETTLRQQRTWKSPSGGSYPVKWRLENPAFDLVVEAAFDAQEMNTAVRYWEGAVKVVGSRNGKEVTGKGYLEMTGYATPEVNR